MQFPFTGLWAGRGGFAPLGESGLKSPVQVCLPASHTPNTGSFLDTGEGFQMPGFKNGPLLALQA